VIRRGKRHVLDFGRKWGPRYLSTFRGVPFDTKEVAEAFLHHIELEYSSGDLTLDRPKEVRCLRVK
jgi:hypothetical protein